jgi:DNA-binding NarL/FixJ family response regulator
MPSHPVLLLEDEPFIAIDLEGLLRENGWDEVVTLTTCTAAMDWLAANTPRIAIVDPRLNDGICSEVARTLVKRRIPFIVYTGEATSLTDAEPAFAEGELLPKPSLPEDIVDAVERAAELHEDHPPIGIRAADPILIVNINRRSVEWRLLPTMWASTMAGLHTASTTSGQRPIPTTRAPLPPRSQPLNGNISKDETPRYPIRRGTAIGRRNMRTAEIDPILQLSTMARNPNDNVARCLPMRTVPLFCPRRAAAGRDLSLNRLQAGKRLGIHVLSTHGPLMLSRRQAKRRRTPAAASAPIAVALVFL